MYRSEVNVGRIDESSLPFHEDPKFRSVRNSALHFFQTNRRNLTSASGDEGLEAMTFTYPPEPKTLKDFCQIYEETLQVINDLCNSKPRDMGGILYSRKVRKNEKI